MWCMIDGTADWSPPRRTGRSCSGRSHRCKQPQPIQQQEQQQEEKGGQEEEEEEEEEWEEWEGESLEGRGML